MILIRKSPEPADWRRQRRTPGVDFDGTEKTVLRDSLLKEQGYLCAYCMKRIRLAKDVKIEHYQARNPQNQFDYENLLAVCTGNATLLEQNNKVDPERFTCDSRKRNQELHINPQNETDMQTVYYDNQGRVYSDLYQDAMPFLNKWKRYCYGKNVDGEYPEYVGIMRWFVNRQIRKHQ